MRVELFGASLEIDEGLVDAPVPVIEEQVAEYERGERRTFDLEVALPDSFTGEVMAAMLAIPYGETRTYGDLASQLGTSPVAVGGGCARNPVPLVVPCHRVVASDGSLRGYSAEGGIETKRRLLDFEREDGHQTTLAAESTDRTDQTHSQTARR